MLSGSESLKIKIRIKKLRSSDMFIAPYEMREINDLNFNGVGRIFAFGQKL